MAAGAPKGNTNGAKAKLWTAAINRALDKRTKLEGKEAMDTLAEKLLVLCDEGNLSALQEFGSRIEGKPAQSMDVNLTAMSHEDALAALEDGADG